MRKISLILCVALLLGILSGCNTQPAYVPTGTGLTDDKQEGPTAPTAPGVLEEVTEAVTVAYYAADGFNPYTCENFTNRLVFSLLYQGLFTVGADYKVEPMLCSSYTVSDNMRGHTYYIDAAATFSDGTPVTAADVIASFDAAKDSSVYGGRFIHIASYEAQGDNCVSITTDCKYENLPILLDIPIVKADQVAEPMPIASGPYSLAQAAGGLVLQKDPDWWGKVSLPTDAGTILLRAANDPAQIRDWFEFEDLSVAYADPGAASYVEYRCDYEVWDCETGLFLYLGCNGKSKIFSNTDVLAALPYAIDREQLLQVCYNGFGQSATLAASPNSPYYDKGLAAQVTYDPDRLRLALTNAGLIGAEGILLVNKNDSVRLQAARMIVQMLNDCGLKLTVQDNSTPYYRENLFAGNYDIYLGQTRLSSNMDLSAFYAPYGNLSWGNMSDTNCYSMALQALENSGNYYNLHQLALRQGRLCPVLFRTYAVYTKRGIMKDFYPARDNVFWYSMGKDMTSALVTETD